MHHYWGHSNDFFDQGYRAVRGSLLWLGGFLVFFGALIFAFPKLIAFLFAAFIVFLGVSLLVAGYKFWKLSRMPRPFLWKPEDDNEGDGQPRHYERRTITFIFR